ncbi:MAG: hypothetical protein ACE5IY_23645, partial [bacterium]
LFSCAPTLPKVKKVTELSPPFQVSTTIAGDSLIVRWQPSPHEPRPDFAGYNLYVSGKSLVFAAVAELPVPALVGKERHQLVLPTPEGSPIFVHMRSRTKNGEISLPSLPELTISGSKTQSLRKERPEKN